MIVVVTGGRDFAAAGVVWDVLDKLHAQERFSVRLSDGTVEDRAGLALLAHGACGVDGDKVDERALRGGLAALLMRGADRLAHEWAARNRVLTNAYPVRQSVDGPWPAAGPRRNARMLNDLDDRAFLGSLLVVAFDGGRGTANCVETALRLGRSVWRISGTGPYSSELLTREVSLEARWAAKLGTSSMVA